MSDSKNTVAEPSQSLAEQAFEAARHDTKREHATEIRNFEIATGAAATAAGAGVVAVEHMRKISEAIETRTEDAVGYYVAADSTPTTVDFTYQSYSQPDNARRENLDLSENGQLALTYSWLTEIGDENQKGIPVPALKAGDGLWDLAAHSHRLYADMVALAAGYWDIDLLAQEDQLSTSIADKHSNGAFSAAKNLIHHVQENPLLQSQAAQKAAYVATQAFGAAVHHSGSAHIVYQGVHDASKALTNNVESAADYIARFTNSMLTHLGTEPPSRLTSSELLRAQVIGLREGLREAFRILGNPAMDELIPDTIDPSDLLTAIGTRFVQREPRRIFNAKPDDPFLYKIARVSGMAAVFDDHQVTPLSLLGTYKNKLKAASAASAS